MEWTHDVVKADEAMLPTAADDEEPPSEDESASQSAAGQPKASHGSHSSKEAALHRSEVMPSTAQIPHVGASSEDGIPSDAPIQEATGVSGKSEEDSSDESTS